MKNVFLLWHGRGGGFQGMGGAGREDFRYKRPVCPSWMKGFVIGLCLVSFVVSSSGCTVMLAGMVVEAIVTEIKSREKNPEKNEVVYEVLARDTEKNVSYLVEAHVKTKWLKEQGVTVQYVETLHIAYVNQLEQDVTLTDLDGDGIVDRIQVGERLFFPPASCTSSAYPLLRTSQAASPGGSGLVRPPAPENPWYRFSERDRLQKTPKTHAGTIDAYAFQQRYARIAVAALKQLDFEARGEQGPEV